MVDTLTKKYLQLYRQGQSIEQIALSRFIDAGDMSKHIKSAKEIYQQRQHILRTELIKAYQNNIKVWGGSAGTHLTISFQKYINDKICADKINSLGISVKPLSEFYFNDTKNNFSGFVIGYGSTDEKIIPRLVQEMKKITG